MAKDPLLRDFTREKWEIVVSILSGETDKRVSWAGAARAAGVTPEAIRRWKRRSESPRPDDDPLIVSIAPFLNSIKELQAGRLEDKVWERAMKGVKEPVYYKGIVAGYRRKVDNNLLLKLLKVRDERYIDRIKTSTDLNEDDKIEIYKRLLGATRVAEAKQLEKATVDMVENADGVFDLPEEAKDYIE